MNNGIISLLKVPGFKVLDVQIWGEEITISVRKRSKTARCPCCLKRTKRLKDYRPPSRILHMMLCNQRVYLSLRKRRFYCSSCKKVFTEKLSFLSARSRKSAYAKCHALERLSDSSFKITSQRVGISYGSLVTLLKKVFSQDTIKWSEQITKGVIRLGIDEHHFGRKNKYLVTIANLLTGKPIHILPNDQKKTLVNFLKTLPNEVKERIEEVAVDMKTSFIRAIEETLPKARIVIDHFHIIQDANRRVNDARKIEDDVQEKIKGNGPKRIPWRLLTRNKENLKGKQTELVDYYLRKFPAVSIFYACKEKLRDMYKAETKQEAEQILVSLIRFMRESEYPELYLWANTLKRHEPYILNYFDNHTTNAVTEGLHRKFKLIQRQAFGFRNPEVYIRRVMLAFLPLTLLRLYPHY